MKPYSDSHILRRRSSIVASVLVFLAAVAPGHSAIVSITIYPTDNNYAVDSNIDGTFDFLATKYSPYFLLHSSLSQAPLFGIEAGDVRSAFEFDLSLVPAGAQVISSWYSFGPFGGGIIPEENPTFDYYRNIYGYSGDGIITLSDFSNVTLTTKDVDFDFVTDVTQSTRSLVSMGASHQGIIHSMGVMGTTEYLASLDHVPPGPTPSLIITYNTVPEPSNITLIAGTILFALTKRTRRSIQRRATR